MSRASHTAIRTNARMSSRRLFRPFIGRERASSRRFLPFIGPGLVLAVIASVLVWRLAPPNRTDAPRIERTRVTATLAAPATAPDPEWLLARRDSLGLDRAREERLARLATRWKRDTRALREAIDRESAEIDRAMSGKGSKNLSIDEVRDLAAPLSDLSRQLSAARSAWWSETSTVLRPDQRKRAEDLWRDRFVRRIP